MGSIDSIATPIPHKNLILSVNAGSSSLKISLYRLLPNTPPPPPSSVSPNSPLPEPVELLLVSNFTELSSPPASYSFLLSPLLKPITPIIPANSNSNNNSSTSNTSGSPSFSSIPPLNLTPTPNAEVKKHPIESIKNHSSAFTHFLDHLEREVGIKKEEIVHVCHRVVHGGDYFEPVVINDESYHHLERLSDLAPLHNGAALSVMKACITYLPTANSIAYFDTSFHRSIPPHIASYAIDQTVAKKKGLKKYGFHGLSYAYILRSVSHFLQKPPSSTNLIILHLGSGASACAIKSGRSLDTSMGLTPLNGLPGATRSGAVDPSLIFHYTNKASRMSHDRSQAVDVHLTLAEDILNRKSGWKVLTGTTDFGEIVRKMKEVEVKIKEKREEEEEEEDGGSYEPSADEAKWALAFDLFIDRITNYVGSYYLKLGGNVDALVFSGGIGERSVELREEVVKRMECIGFKMDKEANEKAAENEECVVEITGGEEGEEEGKEENGDEKEKRKHEKRRVLVCKTDEQLEMARECALAERFWKDK